MNLLADESVDKPIVDRLRQDGHAVTYMAELLPGATDDVVLQQANSQNALLLTADKDFGELVFRQRRVHSGVVLIRMPGLSTTLKTDLVAATIRSRAAEIPGAFTVISPAMVRIRRTL
jgi:predicted nuclease of predicted toxin-antitoxin system